MQGEAAAGVAHLRQALASPDVGPEALRSYWLAALAEAYGRAGQPQAGLQVLAEAVTLMATTEMRWWEAEVYRLQGELLLHLPSPDVPQAEAAFLRALDVARRQQAKALELRAALSLRGSGRVKGSAQQPASCWRRSTAGSRRALTRLTFRRPKPCWQSWGAKRPFRYGGTLTARAATMTIVKNGIVLSIIINGTFLKILT